MSRDPMPSLTRRRLLSAAAAAAATTTLPLRAAASLPTTWIPPDWLLDDLPRQMRALGVPGIGIAVVEDPATAFASAMPAAALEIAGADHCVSLPAMPKLLETLCQP